MERAEEDFEKMKDLVINIMIGIIAVLVIFSDFFFPGQTDNVHLIYSYFALMVLGCLFYGFFTEFMQKKKFIKQCLNINAFKHIQVTLYFITVCTLYTTTILIFLLYPYGFLLRKYGIDDYLQYIVAGSAIIILIQHSYADIRFQIHMNSILRKFDD